MRPIHLSFVIGAAILGGMSATAQDSDRERLREEWKGGHEEMRDPPAPRRIQRVSPRREETIAAFTSVQVNVNGQGQNILGDAANEPSMTVDPTNPNRVAVGWRQFDSVNSNFRQAGNAFSMDGGSSWTMPTVLTPGTFRSDPVLATTKTGVFHYNSLQNSFFTDEFRSLNQGQTYTLLGPATGGDKQWITIDTTNSQGAGHIYQWWSTAGNNYGGRQFSRSTDGGSTWLNPVFLPSPIVWGTLDVNSNGDLFLGGTTFSDDFRCIRSTNAKNPAVTPTFDLNRSVNMGGVIAFGLSVNPDGLGGQCNTVVDRSNGPTAGNVYMLCSIDRGGSNPADVMMNRSTDGGNTWGSPIRVNNDATGQGKLHWFGSLAVAPNGRLDAVWYDTRNSANNTLSQLYHSYSLDGGVSWSANIAVSPAFNTLVGFPNQNKIGDYIGIVSDNVGCRVIYAATFNGEQDIYFVRIVAAPQDLPTGSFTIVRGLLLSGGLASLQQVDGDRLVVQRGFVPNSSDAPIQVAVEGVSPVTAPSRLRFDLTAQASSGSLAQTVELYNFANNGYDILDVRQATVTDSTTTVTVSANAFQYVDPGTGTVRAKVSYKPNAPIQSSNYTASLNKTSWVATP